MEKDEYQKELRKYERLGALQFKKLVFLVEKVKFKVLKKVFPNFIYRIEKLFDFRQKRFLKRAKTEEEKNAIREHFKLAKMEMRKEWNREKSRNYHLDSKQPTELIKYLEWNKSVHKKGLIKNAILIPVIIFGIVFQFPLMFAWISFFVVQCISAVVNFECINIQNYNLCRVKRIQPYLERKEEKQRKKNIEEFGDAAAVIHKSIEESESLPTFDEILSNINDLEQLRQMREMFKREHEERQAQKAIGGK